MWLFKFRQDFVDVFQLTHCRDLNLDGIWLTSSRMRKPRPRKEQYLRDGDRAQAELSLRTQVRSCTP